MGRERGGTTSGLIRQGRIVPGRWEGLKRQKETRLVCLPGECGMEPMGREDTEDL